MMTVLRQPTDQTNRVIAPCRLCTWIQTLILGLSLGFSTYPLSASAAERSKPIVVCDDGLWPPYTFKAEGSKDQYIGASYQLLIRIMSEVGIDFRFVAIPWKRCLASVEAFNTSGIEAFFNATINEDRLAKYFPSKPIYQTHLGYAFNSENKDIPQRVAHISELNRYRICGVLGYNYDNEIKAGLKTSINTVSKTVQMSIDRVVDHKCDYLLTTYEVVSGGLKIGQLKSSPKFQLHKSPGFDPITFHFWVSQSSKRAKPFLEKFNTALLALQKSGEADQIFNEYFPEGGDGIP